MRRKTHVNLTQFTQCPYDSTQVFVDSYEGGVYLVSCECCGAAWEAHANWVARVKEPDWDIVTTFREIQSLYSTLD